MPDPHPATFGEAPAVSELLLSSAESPSVGFIVLGVSVTPRTPAVDEAADPRTRKVARLAKATRCPGGEAVPTVRRGRSRSKRDNCDNTLSAPHLVGDSASQTVSSGSPVGEYPPRKKFPKSTHARRRTEGDASSDKHELWDRNVICLPQRPRGTTHASLSYPVRSPQTLRKPSADPLKRPPENPPQRPSKDPRKTLLRNPQRTLGEQSPQGPWGQSPRRTAKASNTALSTGGGRVLSDTLAAPRGQGRGVLLVNSPSRAHIKLGP